MVDVIRARAVRGSEIELEGAKFTLDATVRETHSVEAEVTSHPAEKGVDIGDHFQVRGKRLVLEGIVTNSPLPSQETDEIPNRDVDGWSQLEAVMELAELVQVKTGLKVYDDMALVGLSTERTGAGGQAIRPVLEFEYVRIVGTKQARIPSRGRVSTKPSRAFKKAESEARRRDWIRRGRDPKDFDRLEAAGFFS